MNRRPTRSTARLPLMLIAALALSACGTTPSASPSDAPSATATARTSTAPSSTASPRVSAAPSRTPDPTPAPTQTPDADDTFAWLIEQGDLVQPLDPTFPEALRPALETEARTVESALYMGAISHYFALSPDADTAQVILGYAALLHASEADTLIVPDGSYGQVSGTLEGQLVVVSVSPRDGTLFVQISFE